MISAGPNNAALATTESHSPKQKRLTALDIGWMLKAHKEGMSQVDIAQRLGVTQSAICRWLEKTTDSKDVAKSFLAGQALRMAKNIVSKGLARDHVQVLNGLGVLQAQESQGLTLVINGLTLHGTGRDAAVEPALEGEILSPLQLPEQGEGQQNP